MRPCRQYQTPVHFYGVPGAEPTMRPRLGAQTEQVPGELLGPDAAAVQALKDRGVV